MVAAWSVRPSGPARRPTARLRGSTAIEAGRGAERCTLGLLQRHQHQLQHQLPLDGLDRRARAARQASLVTLDLPHDPALRARRLLDRVGSTVVVTTKASFCSAYK